MAVVSKSVGQFTVNAYTGDNKTLLAFDFDNADLAKNLAGFTIQCQLPNSDPAFYLYNLLQFETPADHAQDGGDSHLTSNAPIQKFRWVDFAHAAASGGALLTGTYTYNVTPRYFDGNGKMLAIDAKKCVSLNVHVGPFAHGKLSVGFTRGYMQSQAYVRHFGAATPIEPKNRALQYDTSSQAGTNDGKPVLYTDIYEWMGETAREQIFATLNEVENNSSLSLKVFAYDMNEPDIVTAFLKLTETKRIKMILDSASLHVTHTVKGKTVTPLEQNFFDAFSQAAGADYVKHGCFGRYSHDKILIVLKNNTPVKVLTGSTNFSVTGVYVNANHVLVFDEPEVAEYYEQVFDASWAVLDSSKIKPSPTIAKAFAANPLANDGFSPKAANVPKMTINVSPHTAAYADKLLGDMAQRIESEGQAKNGSVLFAVMQLALSKSPVCDALINIHDTQTVYSYGISDAPGGIELYAPGKKTGVIVTGKPSHVLLPPPFDQVPSPSGHEIHDKFVVCGLNGPDPVVWCGSSNLALGGEESNGDNLLEIHDADVAAVFAIEALLLVDHYNFLDRYAQPPKTSAPKAPKGTKAAAKKAVAKKAAAKKITAKKAVAKKTARKGK